MKYSPNDDPEVSLLASVLLMITHQPSHQNTATISKAVINSLEYFSNRGGSINSVGMTSPLGPFAIGLIAASYGYDTVLDWLITEHHIDVNYSYCNQSLQKCAIGCYYKVYVDQFNQYITSLFNPTSTTSTYLEQYFHRGNDLKVNAQKAILAVTEFTRGLNQDTATDVGSHNGDGSTNNLPQSSSSSSSSLSYHPLPIPFGHHNQRVLTLLISAGIPKVTVSSSHYPSQLAFLKGIQNVALSKDLLLMFDYMFPLSLRYSENMEECLELFLSRKTCSTEITHPLYEHFVKILFPFDTVITTPSGKLVGMFGKDSSDANNDDSDTNHHDLDSDGRDKDDCDTIGNDDDEDDNVDEDDDEDDDNDDDDEDDNVDENDEDDNDNDDDDDDNDGPEPNKQEGCFDSKDAILLRCLVQSPHVTPHHFQTKLLEYLQNNNTTKTPDQLCSLLFDLIAYFLHSIRYYRTRRHGNIVIILLTAFFKCSPYLSPKGTKEYSMLSLFNALIKYSPLETTNGIDDDGDPDYNLNITPLPVIPTWVSIPSCPGNPGDATEQAHKTRQRKQQVDNKHGDRTFDGFYGPVSINTLSQEFETYMGVSKGKTDLDAPITADKHAFHNITILSKIINHLISHMKPTIDNYTSAIHILISIINHPQLTCEGKAMLYTTFTQYIKTCTDTDDIPYEDFHDSMQRNRHIIMIDLINNLPLWFSPKHDTVDSLGNLLRSIFTGYRHEFVQDSMSSMIVALTNSAIRSKLLDCASFDLLFQTIYYACQSLQYDVQCMLLHSLERLCHSPPDFSPSVRRRAEQVYWLLAFLDTNEQSNSKSIPEEVLQSGYYFFPSDCPSIPSQPNPDDQSQQQHMVRVYSHDELKSTPLYSIICEYLPRSSPLDVFPRDKQANICLSCINHLYLFSSRDQKMAHYPVDHVENKVFSVLEESNDGTAVIIDIFPRYVTDVYYVTSNYGHTHNPIYNPFFVSLFTHTYNAIAKTSFKRQADVLSPLLYSFVSSFIPESDWQTDVQDHPDYSMHQNKWDRQLVSNTFISNQFATGYYHDVLNVLTKFIPLFTGNKVELEMIQFLKYITPHSIYHNLSHEVFVFFIQLFHTHGFSVLFTYFGNTLPGICIPQAFILRKLNISHLSSSVISDITYFDDQDLLSLQYAIISAYGTPKCIESIPPELQEEWRQGQLSVLKSFKNNGRYLLKSLIDAYIYVSPQWFLMIDLLLEMDILPLVTSPSASYMVDSFKFNDFFNGCLDEFFASKIYTPDLSYYMIAQFAIILLCRYEKDGRNKLPFDAMKIHGSILMKQPHQTPLSHGFGLLSSVLLKLHEYDATSRIDTKLPPLLPEFSYLKRGDPAHKSPLDASAARLSHIHHLIKEYASSHQQQPLSLSPVANGRGINAPISPFLFTNLFCLHHFYESQTVQNDISNGILHTIFSSPTASYLPGYVPIERLLGKFIVWSRARYVAIYSLLAAGFIPYVRLDKSQAMGTTTSATTNNHTGDDVDDDDDDFTLYKTKDTLTKILLHLRQHPFIASNTDTTKYISTIRDIVRNNDDQTVEVCDNLLGIALFGFNNVPRVGPVIIPQIHSSITPLMLPLFSALVFYQLKHRFMPHAIINDGQTGDVNGENNDNNIPFDQDCDDDDDDDDDDGCNKKPRGKVTKRSRQPNTPSQSDETQQLTMFKSYPVISLSSWSSLPSNSSGVVSLQSSSSHDSIIDKVQTFPVRFQFPNILSALAHHPCPFIVQSLFGTDKPSPCELSSSFSQSLSHFSSLYHVQWDKIVTMDNYYPCYTIDTISHLNGGCVDDTEEQPSEDKPSSHPLVWYTSPSEGIFWYVLHHVSYPSIDDITFLLTLQSMDNHDDISSSNNMSDQDTKPGNNNHDEANEMESHFDSTPLIDLTKTNSYGEDILMHAILRRWPEASLLFIINRLGMSYVQTHKDNDGFTAVDYAFFCNTQSYAPGVVELLTEGQSM